MGHTHFGIGATGLPVVGRGADMQLVVQHGSRAARNDLRWQKFLADLILFINFRPNLDDFGHFWTQFGNFLTF